MFLGLKINTNTVKYFDSLCWWLIASILRKLRTSVLLSFWLVVQTTCPAAVTVLLLLVLTCHMLIIVCIYVCTTLVLRTAPWPLHALILWIKPAAVRCCNRALNYPCATDTRTLQTRHRRRPSNTQQWRNRCPHLGTPPSISWIAMSKMRGAQRHRVKCMGAAAVPVPGARGSGVGEGRRPAAESARAPSQRKRQKTSRRAAAHGVRI